MSDWPRRVYDPAIFIASSGKRLTIGLFHETCAADTESKPSFSLKEWHDAYIAIGDPTGYTQAMYLVGDWDHWQLLRKTNALKPIFDQWDKELEIKLRSEAVKSLVQFSKDIKGQAAAKWLAEAGFRVGEEKRDGRRKGSKEEEAFVKKEVSDKVREDMKRLGFEVVGGGRE